MRQSPQRLLQRQRLVDLGVHVAVSEPDVPQLRPTVQVDRRDDAHVGLPPLAPAIGHLGLEEFEGVEPQEGVWDFQGLAQDRAGFVLHEEEAAVGFAAGDLLHDPEEGYRGEEVAPAVCFDWGLGEWGGGVA